MSDVDTVLNERLVETKSRLLAGFSTRIRRLLLAVLSTTMVATALVVAAGTVATANPASGPLSTECVVRADVTPDGTAQSGVQAVVPGEWATFALVAEYDPGDVYQDILRRPDGSIYYASYLELTDLADNLVLDPASVQVLTAPGGDPDPVANGTPLPGLLTGTTPDPANFVLATSAAGTSTTWTLLFPGDEPQMLADVDGDGDLSYTVPAAGEIFVMTFRAQMPVGSAWGSVESGAECFASVSTGPSNIDTDRPTVAISAIHPELNVTKFTSPDNAYQGGALVEYTLTAEAPPLDQATSTLTTAAVRDAVLVDNVPVGLQPVDAAGLPVIDGGTTSGGGVWDATARTVTYQLGDIVPDSSVNVTSTMQVDQGLAPATVLTNSVTGIISFLPGDNPDDTVIDPADSDTAEIIVASNSPEVTKRALRIPDGTDLENYGTELPFWYEVTVVVPPSSSYENFTILDLLPDGMTFLNYVSETCSGAVCPAAIPPLPATVFPAGAGTGIGWYPNQLAFDAGPRTLTLRYEVQLEPTYSDTNALQFFDAFTNDLSINWNTVDRLGAVPPSTGQPPPFDGSVETDDTVIYDRPVLTIDKSVATSDGVAADTVRESWDYEIGDIATYTSTITNIGSSDAANLTVVDTPTGFTIDPATITVGGTPCVGCTFTGSVLTISIPGPIPPGATLDIVYDATPVTNGDIDNVIEIPTYEDPFGTPYTENPEDEVGLQIPDPNLALAKDALATTPTTARTIGTLFPFTMTVTNPSSTTAYNAVVTDTVPVTTPVGGICNIFPGGLDPSATGVTETGAGVWSLDNPMAPGDTVTFTVWLEVCGDVDAGTYTNTATLTWEDLSDGTDEAGNAYTTDDTAPLELVDAEFVVTKSPPVDGGATLNWSADLDEPEDGLQADEVNGGVWVITIENTSSVPIGGLVVTDPMPDPFEYEIGTATTTWIPSSATDTFTDNSAPAGGEILTGIVGTPHATQLDFLIGQLAPGAEIIIRVPFSHNGENPADANLTRLNTVTVTNDNLAFDPAAHEDDGEYTLIPVEAGPSIAKTVEIAGTAPGVESVEGAPGQQFDFTLDVSVPSAATFSNYDLWVLDQLPDGLTLANEPAVGSVLNGSSPGWDMTCVSGPCPILTEAEEAGGSGPGGIYLGQQPGSGNRTELSFFLGDTPADPTEPVSVYRITFRVEVATRFNDGTEVVDGVNDPLVNNAAPVSNRSTALPGGSGNLVAGIPGGFPNKTDYDRLDPFDPAEIDIVTPRLDIAKNVTDATGVKVTEVDAGEILTYEIVATNNGTGAAYSIDILDDLAQSGNSAENFVDIDLGSLVVTPAGSSCAIVPGPLGADNLLCEFAGPLAPGTDMTVTYNATTVPNDDFYSQFSSLNFDPMLMRNEALAAEYWEAANSGGNQYSTGEAIARLYAFTPMPEIDAACVGGKDVIPNAPVGSQVQFWAVIGNGDRIDINGNPGGDQTLSPFPTEDLDGDGYPDAGIGYNPVAMITLQDKFTYVGTTATGPGVGDPTYTNYSAFPPPDQILDELQPNTYTLVWDVNSLGNIPHSPNHATQGSFLPGDALPSTTATTIDDGNFLPHYHLLIDVIKTEAGGGTVWYELAFEDAAGNTDRGTNVGEYWEFVEKDRNGCPGGPPPQVWKTPDQEDGVVLAPGQVEEFVITVQAPQDGMAGSFVDTLPAGLQYAGYLAATDPNYAVATMDAYPTGWTDVDGDGDVDLEDYFDAAASGPQPNGDTTLIWNTAPLDRGVFNDDQANGADTRWVIRVPVIALANPPFPNEAVVNSFSWNTEEFGSRQDSGAVTTLGLGLPTMDKRVDQTSGIYGQTFTFTIDVTIPAEFAGKDVVLYDEINRPWNWEAAPFSLQDGGNWADNNRIFPAVPGGLSYWADPAENELTDYVSDTCLSGCAAAPIDAVPMTPWTLTETMTMPLSSSAPEMRSDNGAAGWYLGDITAHPDGLERKLQLVYTVEAPTLLDQRTRLAERFPTTFTGPTDPLFDDPDSIWFTRVSQVNHPNYIELRSFSSDKPQISSVWEGAGDNAWRDSPNNTWRSNFSGSSVVAQADESFTVSYPILEMDKSCRAVGATDEAQPKVAFVGTPNVECTITVENLSPIPAYDVTINDAPLPSCVLAAQRTDSGGVIEYPISTVGYGAPRVTDPTDPGVVTYNCPVSGIAVIPSTGSVPTGSTTLPLQWDLVVGAGATETLTYQFNIDGWTNMPVASLWDHNGNWELQGRWINNASMQPWSDEPGGNSIGELTEVSDSVGFTKSLIGASKFPYPMRNVCTQTRPFTEWLGGAPAGSVNIWPHRYTQGTGNAYNPAAWWAAPGVNLGNPYDGTYWMNGLNSCADPLQPPERESAAASHPWNMRGYILGTNWSTYSGWQNFGDPINPVGWWNRPLDDIANWDPVFLADPTVPYTWAINLRVDGLQHLTDIDILDTLPVGWEYVPGSAVIVDGVWMLGNHPSATYGPDVGLTPGYGLIPIPDPARGNIGGGSCHNDINYHSGGETLTWNFERDTGANQPWLYQYVDASQRVIKGDVGSSQKGNWIRIHFDAIPTAAVFDCDPDPTSVDTFFMENNLRVSAQRDNPILGQGIELVDTYDMLAPVPNPLAFEKLPDDDFVGDDTTAYYTIRFTNGLDVPVTDLLIVDDLSADIAPEPGGGYVCGTATATATAVGFTEPVCTGGTSQNTHIEWVIGSVAPGDTIEITIPIVIPVDETNTLQWSNTANLTVKEWYDSPFTDAGKITVLNPSPPQVPVKTVSPNPATINDVVEYTVTWTAEGRMVFMDLAYFDTIPDGLTFESFQGITCTGACPNGYNPSDVIEMTPVVNADGTTTLMWWFGDMPGSASPHTWTMTYRATVDDTYNDGSLVLDEDVLTNEVIGWSNEENLLDDPVGVIDSSRWTTYPPSTPSTADLDIEEPELAISKSAIPSATPTDGSATIQFLVEVENVGGMDAQNVIINDTPNGALENIVTDPTTYPGSVVTQGWTAIAPTVQWFIPTLGQGDTATFTYVAEVTDSFLSDGFAFADNNAEIEEFWARPGSDPDPGDRSYTGDSASTQVPLVAPTLEIDKFAGDCSSEFNFAAPFQSFVWCIEVTNVGEAIAYDVLVGDTLPFEWTYDGGSTTGAGWTAAEPVLSFPTAGVQGLQWMLGDLAPSATAQIRFTARPFSGAPLNVTNWASAQSFQADGSPLPPTVAGAQDSDPASAAMGRFALEIAKTPDQQQWPVPNGGQATVTWDLTITNPASDTDNTDLLVTDYLPADLTYVSTGATDPRVSSAVTSAGPGGTTAIRWNITDLAAGETIVIPITASISSSAMSTMSWYVNDVQVTSNEVQDEVVNQAKVRFFERARLGNYTWLDTNGDGQQAGESGVDGVLVSLLDAAGNLLYRDPLTGLIVDSIQYAGLSSAQQAAYQPMVVTTGDNPGTPGVEQGWYYFDDLPPATYIVHFDPSPTGLYLTTQDQGPDGSDSDANTFTGLSHAVNLGNGDDDPTIDAGLITAEDYFAGLAEVDIEKATNGVDADAPTGPAISVGDPVIWTYQVENTGSVALLNAAVTDSDPSVTVVCDVDGNGAFDDATNVMPLLLPGGTVSCQSTGTAGSGPYTNTATVSGAPAVPQPATCGCDPGDASTWPNDADDFDAVIGSDGDPLPPETATDPSHYFGTTPAIEIEKFTNGVQADISPGPALAVGDPVVWTYEVENTGNTALLNVTVADSDPAVSVICDVNDDGNFDPATESSTIGLLNPGDTTTCEATGVAAAGQYRNISSVAGDPFLPDPDTCGCSPDDPDSWPDDPTNFDPAVGSDGTPMEAVENEDPSHYYAADPDVDIEKSTNGVQADGPTGPAIAPGLPVTWTYEVTNTGNTALADATVTDSDLSVTVICDLNTDGTFDPVSEGNVIAHLNPGESRSCQATGIAGVGQYTNTASISGQPVLPDPVVCGCSPFVPSSWPSDPAMFDPATDASGDPLPNETDEDLSHYVGAAPRIDIEKTTNAIQADQPTGPALEPGDPVTWRYLVRNTGSTALLSSVVTDSDPAVTPVCDVNDDGLFLDATNVIPLLNPGDSILCQATSFAATGPYQNVADVAGVPAYPNPDTCGCNPFDPDSWPDSANDFAPLLDPDGNPVDPVADADPSHYFGAAPNVDIEKFTNGVQADQPAGPALALGAAVTWTYVVQNTGNTALTAVTVTDSDPAVSVDCFDATTAADNTMALLLPGETRNCEATGTAGPGQYENQATVSGAPALPNPDGCACGLSAPDSWPSDPALYDEPTDDTGDPLDDVTDNDLSHYFGAAPAVDVEKSTAGVNADAEPGPGIAAGDPVVWTYVVTNTGNTALADVSVTDSDPTVSVVCDLNDDGVFNDATNVINHMNPGDVVNCRAEGIAVSGQYQNSVDVSGDPVLPNPDTCECDPGDPTSWPDDPSAFDRATEPDGTPVPPVADDDPSHYFGSEGGIDLEKATNGVDADLPPGPAIAPSGLVTWTYTVTNSSDTALTGVVVTDSDPAVSVDCADPASTGANEIALLLPGAVATCDATGTAAAGQYENTAMVSGSPALPDPDTCGCDLSDSSTWPADPAVFTPVLDPATGDPVGEVTDGDPSHYFGAAPAIGVEKSTQDRDADVTPGPAVPAGGAVTWTYAVTNTGNTALANVTVTDSDPAVSVDCADPAAASADQIALLLPGDSVICEANGTARTGQYANTVDVVGDPVLPDLGACGCDPASPDSWPDDPLAFDPATGPDGTPVDGVTDDDPSHYYGTDGGLTLEKSTNGQDADVTPGPAVTPTGAVTWTYVVTNTSSAALAAVEIDDSDPLVAVDCGDAAVTGTPHVIALLAPGATVTCTASGTATAGQYQNVADVSGTPVAPNPDTCGCNPDDPGTWPPDPDQFAPLVDPATGDPLPPMTATDPSHYFGADPDVSLAKSTNGVDADLTPGPAIPAGDPVTWIYAVTNTGNTALTNVVVSDSDPTVAVDCFDPSTADDDVIALLLPGAVVSCEATGTAIAGQYENVATVVGTPALPDPDTCGCDPAMPSTWPDDPDAFAPALDDAGEPMPPAEDGDPSHYFGTDGSLTLEKATNGVDADQPFGPSVISGTTVVWTYVVTNTSATALAPVVVSDSDPTVAVDCGDTTNVIPLLVPGQTVTCMATGTAIDGAYSNQSTATGNPVAPDPATCGCDPDAPRSWPGDAGLYAPLVDPATGEPAAPLTGDDPSHYFGTAEILSGTVSGVAGGQIELEKSTNGADADTSPGIVLAEGETVTWSYVITNPANTALLDVTVTDDQGVAIDCGDGSATVALLPLGQSVTCTGEVSAAAAGGYTNIGSVSGAPALPNPDTCDCDPADPASWPDDPAEYDPVRDQDGTVIDRVEDEDPSNYYGVGGGIDIEKSTNGFDADDAGPGLLAGSTVTWTYVVTNTSDAALGAVAVSDDDPTVTVSCPGAPGDAANVIALLLPGASVSCTASGVSADGDYQNVGSAEGQLVVPDPDVCDCDPDDPNSWPDDPTQFEPVTDATTGDPVPPVSDLDPSSYTGLRSGIDLEKATNGLDADNPPGPSLAEGASVTWTYKVRNTGDSALLNVTVTDMPDPGVDCGGGSPVIPLLLPYQTVTCTATGEATAGYFENRATAAGTPATPNLDTCDCDPSKPQTWPTDVSIFEPLLDPVSGAAAVVDDDDPSHYVGIGDPVPTPTAVPTVTPEPEPTEEPTATPTAIPEPEPTATPDPEPTAAPEPEPTEEPTATPEPEPTEEPTAVPEPEPTATPEPEPTEEPTAVPEPEPTAVPEPKPTEEPTATPTAIPEPEPTATPEPEATATPTAIPEPEPTEEPTATTEPEPTATAVPIATATPVPTEPVDPPATVLPTLVPTAEAALSAQLSPTPEVIVGLVATATPTPIPTARATATPVSGTGIDDPPPAGLAFTGRDSFRLLTVAGMLILFGLLLVLLRRRRASSRW